MQKTKTKIEKIVKKRDGRLQTYDRNKIIQAIHRAAGENQRVNEINEVVIQVEERLNRLDNQVLSVTTIDNIVLVELEKYPLKKIANQYKKYFLNKSLT